MATKPTTPKAPARKAPADHLKKEDVKRLKDLPAA